MKEIDFPEGLTEEEKQLLVEAFHQNMADNRKSDNNNQQIPSINA